MSRVLVIDDSPTQRHVLTTWLTGIGHTVFEAHDAETGMALAIQQKPDVILMDVVLPGKNGFEATRALQRNPLTQSIPIVIVSSKSQPSDLMWGKKQGASAYLPKPFTQQQLFQELEKVLKDPIP